MVFEDCLGCIVRCLTCRSQVLINTLTMKATYFNVEKEKAWLKFVAQQDEHTKDE